MAAEYIFAALAAVFVALALGRLVRKGVRIDPASRTWILIASVFTAVAAWLWCR